MQETRLTKLQIKNWLAHRRNHVRRSLRLLSKTLKWFLSSYGAEATRGLAWAVLITVARHGYLPEGGKASLTELSGEYALHELFRAYGVLAEDQDLGTECT